MPLKRGIEKAVTAVTKAIKDTSIEVKSNEEIRNVAVISSNNDETIGSLIADAMEKIGRDGIVAIEESQNSETTLEIVEGMQFENGYVSPYFITDAHKMVAELKDPVILLYDGKIMNIQPLVPVLEMAVHNERPLLILAESIDGEALTTLIMNKVRGTVMVAAVKSPGFGDVRKDMLQDIATLTAGQIVAEELGVKLEKTQFAMLGQAEKVIISHNTTTIVGGKGSKDAINARVEQIKTRITESQSEYDIEKLKERIAKLSSGVAMIKVGAVTEAELKEKKMRIDDALHATRAAVEEGIVPGGGVALLKAAESLKDVKTKNPEEALGVEIVRQALSAPITQIILNAGGKPDVIINEIITKNYAVGYDANDMEIKDLLKAGIIDPTKVVRSALQNAASIASLLLTTETVIVELPSEKTTDQPVMPNMGGMM